MRVVVLLIAIVVLIGILGIMTGFINLSGQPGALPRVAVEGGRLPTVQADVGSIDVGTRNTTVAVPTVETERRTVAVPAVEVNRAR